MNIEETKDGIIAKDVKDFNIMQTLECGQCFHFEKLGEMEYGVVHDRHLIHIMQKGETLICRNTNKSEFENVWVQYFDLDRDYAHIKKEVIRADERLKKSVEANSGVRILKQSFDETLMSFIISQNKQIPHIKKIVRDISEKYGDYLGKIGEMDFYAFPDRGQLKNLSEEDYRACKTGFRAPYLYDAAVKLSGDGFEEEMLKSIGYDSAKEKLISIKGVGDKVADCVLLFALGYRAAFPVDVWIKRIMESMYFEKDTNNKEIMRFAREKFGEYGGYAQQYLFYYARENQLYKYKINIKNEKTRKLK